MSQSVNCLNDFLGIANILVLNRLFFNKLGPFDPLSCLYVHSVVNKLCFLGDLWELYVVKKSFIQIQRLSEKLISFYKKKISTKSPINA